MSYIGREPQIGNFQMCDAISVVNNQAAYTMQVGGVAVIAGGNFNVIASVNGVVQKAGTSFTISSSTITFSQNLVTGDVIDFILILGSVLDLGVPSDGTVTTGKIADNAVTSAKLASGLAFGKIGQIVQASDDTQTSLTSTSYVDTGLSATITPSSTSSKVLIMWNNQLKTTTGTSNNILAVIRTLKGSTEVGGGTKMRTDGFTGESGFTSSYAFLDSPSTTNAITYKTQGKLDTSGSGRILFTDISDGGIVAASHILLMEVLA